MSSPPRPQPNLAFFADCPAGTAALKMAYAVNENRELALLIGEAGFGKTTVLRQIHREAVRNGHAVVDVFFPQLDADQLIGFIDGELGTPEDRIGSDRHLSLRRIASHAHRLARKNRGIILIIDDAHLLDDRNTWEAMQSLLNLRQRESAQLTIILAGEKSLLANLGSLTGLSSRIAVTAALAPFDAETTRDYLRHRFPRNRESVPEFGAEVIQRIHRDSGGNPRAINRIAEMAVLLARADRRDYLTPGDLDDLASEFGPRAEAA